MDEIDIGKVSSAALGSVLLPLQFRPIVQRPDHAQWKSGTVTLDITFDHYSFELNLALTRHRGLERVSEELNRQGIPKGDRI